MDAGGNRKPAEGAQNTRASIEGSTTITGQNGSFSSIAQAPGNLCDWRFCGKNRYAEYAQPPAAPSHRARSITSSLYESGRISVSIATICGLFACHAIDP